MNAAFCASVLDCVMALQVTDVAANAIQSSAMFVEPCVDTIQPFAMFVELGVDAVEPGCSSSL